MRRLARLRPRARDESERLDFSAQIVRVPAIGRTPLPLKGAGQEGLGQGPVDRAEVPVHRPLSWALQTAEGRVL
eukprot:NODE_6681_length_614_cov_3.847788_g5704_i0.p5 GENE.NODE_6681_length_614_cov_3.847788_g5704_i0~~NODE_6681_length_614_cov_3.847788_g5704_i0.p5  ORF type:complete len:74 (+),score=4.44 NODE_6681_length_614_cov_3.847788_g5704_i0:168-389(+)